MVFFQALYAEVKSRLLKRG